MFLCSLSDLEDDKSKGFNLGNGQQVFAVQKEGKVHVYENQCPHLGIPLEMMPDQFLDLDNSFIQCSTHGALFEIDNGLCIAGPCSGASLISHEIEIINGEVHLNIKR